jgi:hypothetical protein
LPNKKYFLAALSKYFNGQTISNIELLPFTAKTIDGVLQLAPADYSKFYLTFADRNQKTILNNLPLVYFSNLNAQKKRKMLQLQGVDMQQSFLQWNGIPLITSVPFIIPLLFTSYEKPYEFRIY